MVEKEKIKKPKKIKKEKLVYYCNSVKVKDYRWKACLRDGCTFTL